MALKLNLGYKAFYSYDSRCSDNFIDSFTADLCTVILSRYFPARQWGGSHDDSIFLGAKRYTEYWHLVCFVFYPGVECWQCSFNRLLV